jgi:hypothetical protein
MESKGGSYSCPKNTTLRRQMGLNIQIIKRLKDIAYDKKSIQVNCEKMAELKF